MRLYQDKLDLRLKSLGYSKFTPVCIPYIRGRFSFCIRESTTQKGTYDRSCKLEDLAFAYWISKYRDWLAECFCMGSWVSPFPLTHNYVPQVSRVGCARVHLVNFCEAGFCKSQMLRILILLRLLCTRCTALPCWLSTEPYKLHKSPHTKL